jgi:hypothetical protein
MIELISVHIPKCAGTSFSTVLGRVYGKALVGDQVDQPLDPERPFQKNFAAWKEEQDRKPAPAGVRAIHGHFWAGKYDCQAPTATRITWLRHPIKRLLSHYYFWKSKPELPHSLHKLMLEKDLSLIEFAQLPLLQNVLHDTFLRGRQLEEFEFIGIQEHFREDLDWLVKHMKWRKQAMPEERRTVYQGYDPNNLDAETEKKLRALNEADLEMYETALQMRARRMAPRPLWVRFSDAIGLRPRA